MRGKGRRVQSGIVLLCFVVLSCCVTPAQGNLISGMLSPPGFVSLLGQFCFNIGACDECVESRDWQTAPVEAALARV